MARLTGPESGSRLAYGILAGGELASSATRTAIVYSDSGGTILADILTVGGSPIAGSQVTVGSDSQLPLFQFPDGVDTVYVSVNGGPVTAVYARVTGGGGSGTPSGTVVTETVYGQSSTAGAASTYSRGDHTHGSPSLTANTPAASAVGDTGAVGTGTTPAKDDHRHAREGFGAVTAQTSYGASSSNGTAMTVARSDHAHGTVALTANAPTTSAVGDSAVVGTGTAPARDDHKHGREAFGAAPATTEGIGTAAAAGSATTLARSDHVHPMAAAAAPTASAIGDSSATGVATTFAASDHKHAREALGGAPGSSAVGDSASAGTGTTNARVDHIHGREAFGAVTAQTSYGASSANGSATTVSHSDHTHGTPSLTANTPTTSAVGDAAAVGSGTAPAKDDHRHGRESFAAPTGQAQSTGAAGAAATLVRSDHAHPYENWTHLDHGALAWTFDPATINGQTLTSPVAGTIYLAKLMIPVGVTVTSIWVHVVTAGVGLTASQCLAALFDGSKNLLQTTGDQSGVWNSGGTKQMSITSQALSAGNCYVGLFQNFATSGARFHAGSNGIAAVNFNLSAANSRFATDSTNTGRTTSMPNPLGTLAASSNSIWVALS